MTNDSEVKKEARAELFRLLGVQDDAEGERIVRSIGEHAATMQRLRNEVMKEGVKHGVAAAFNIVKYLIVGAVFYTLWKMGILEKK